MKLFDDKLLATQFEGQVGGLRHVHGQRIDGAHLVQMQQTAVLLESRMRFALGAGKRFQLNGIVDQLTNLGHQAAVL